jgi:hypothetical protein
VDEFLVYSVFIQLKQNVFLLTNTLKSEIEFISLFTISLIHCANQNGELCYLLTGFNMSFCIQCKYNLFLPGTGTTDKEINHPNFQSQDILYFSILLHSYTLYTQLLQSLMQWWPNVAETCCTSVKTDVLKVALKTVIIECLKLGIFRELFQFGWQFFIKV